jgi:hypothetical protein
VIASGAGPLSYQWQKNDADISGATSFTLMLSHVQPGDAGNYRVIVSKAGGSTPSSEATLNVVTAPSITTEPR